jgi:hypothetical protein
MENNLRATPHTRKHDMEKSEKTGVAGSRWPLWRCKNVYFAHLFGWSKPGPWRKSPNSSSNKRVHLKVLFNGKLPTLRNFDHEKHIQIIVLSKTHWLPERSQ